MLLFYLNLSYNTLKYYNLLVLVLAGAGWVVWPQGLCVYTCTVGFLVSKNFPQAKWASINIFPGYE